MTISDDQQPECENDEISESFEAETAEETKDNSALGNLQSKAEILAGVASDIADMRDAAQQLGQTLIEVLNAYTRCQLQNSRPE